MKLPVICLLLLGWLLGIGAMVWSTRQKVRKKAALFVLNGTKSILDAKVPVLTRLLCTRVAARGLAAIGAKSAAAGALLGAAPAGDAVALQRARSLGADYALVVSMHDLDCRADESQTGDLADMRVHTTLCVTYQMLEAASGRVLAGQTLAMCRMTSPIVNGTTVGSDVLNGLLADMAERIAEHLDSLRLAA